MNNMMHEEKNNTNKEIKEWLKRKIKDMLFDICLVISIIISWELGKYLF